MNLEETLKGRDFSRRTFLKGLAVLSAATMLDGCTNKLSNVVEEDAFKKAEEATGEAVWKNAPCWHNCGGTCCLKAQVKGDTIVRLKTDDSHPDSYDYPQQRACVRGLSERLQIVGKERLKYPMKRKHFDPEGKKGKDMRGRDTWERISWDEALDIVASQLKKAKQNYGNKSIYLLDGGEMKRTLALYGGYVAKSGSRSKGCWNKAMEPICGVTAKSHCLNDRMDLMNAKLIILWGCNPAQSSMGMPLLNLRRAKEAGAKIICIDPMFTRTAAVLADEYYPIRPATDTTLLLALSYVIIQKDKEAGGSIIDWDFLNRCTIGFDADHMPEGANVEENYMDYVLGTYDNEPKTPEWASKICGTPVEDINKIAEMIIKNKPTTCLFSWNSARVEKAQHVCLAQMALGCLTGNMGINGGAFSCSSQESSTNGGPNLIKKGKDGIEEIKNPLSKPKLCTNHHWQDIVSGTWLDGKNGLKPLDIHVIYHSHSATLNQTNNVNKGIEAHRKVDFVVTNHYTFTPECQYSDVVLPVTTPWEKEGEVLQGNREAIIWTEKVIEPYFESKDDAWIAEEIAKRLGVDAYQANPVNNKQRCYNIIAGTTVVKENGKDYEKLVSVTEDDLKELGVKGKPQDGRVPILELKKAGIYQVERHLGDNYGYIANKKLRQNPEANPIKTESGKIELYCKALKKAVDKAGWNKGYAYAKYVPPTEGYEATFKDFENGVKGEYPYQVLGIHDLRGTHTVFNQVNYLREAFPYELEVNPIDAKEKGFKEGEVIEIFNSRGKILRKLHITERVMPGVIVIHEGVWVDMKDGRCIAGSPNVLTGDFPSGPDVESWNACIADMRKSSVSLEEDWKVDLAVKLDG